MAKITIELNTDMGDTLDSVFEQFGYVRTSASNYKNDLRGSVAPVQTQENFIDPTRNITLPVETSTRVFDPAIDPNGKFPEPTEPPLTDMDGDRKRGEAGPGHRRRTNAQIDDDKRYLDQKARAEAALAAMDKGVHNDESQPNTIAHDDATADALAYGADETAQDAADEAAETAARPQGPLTLEDLRVAIVRYSDKFGAAASVKNMRGILGCGVEQVKEDDIPAAIFKLEHLIRDGGPWTPFEPPTEVSNKPSVEVATASKADFVEAFKAYARKYDGSDDSSDNGKLIPVTKEDVTKIFVATFGEGTTNLLNIPGGQTPEAFGKIVAAIKQATENNTFDRTIKE